MKYMFASDLHGDIASARLTKEVFASERADRLILLGDLLYHGPRNDLPPTYAPKEVIALLNDMKESLLCVRGNCDAEVDQMVLDFPILADYAVLPLGERLAYLMHGHRFTPEAPPPLSRGDILIGGHTHIPACRPFGRENLYLNPGSVALPKEGHPKSYMIYENGHIEIKAFDRHILYSTIL